MSGPVRHRRPWRRFVRRAVPVAVGLALTATLALALQVHEVRVLGTHRFAAREVEAVLHSALGTPTIAARAESLRAIVREIPWVADAAVRVSLDGVVTCTLTERNPIAVELDGSERRLLDSDGRALGEAGHAPAMLELDGFGGFAEERSAVLAAAPLLQRRWGSPLERVERLGPHDVALHFHDQPCTILADPARPENLDIAHRVLAAWVASNRSAPLRIDVRVAGRAAVLPAPQPPQEAAS